MMHMTFYWGISATLLFDQWVTNTLIQYFMSLLVIVLFGILHEWLFSVRVAVASRKPPPPPPAGASESRVPLLQNVHVQNKGLNDTLVAFLYGVNAGTGYLLMLLVMSFNGGVFIAVVIGLVIGFALFRSNTVSDISCNTCDTCHAA